MIQTIQLTPGVVLRHYPDNRFKTAVLSIQFQRPLEATTSMPADAVWMVTSK